MAEETNKRSREEDEEEKDEGVERTKSEDKRQKKQKVEEKEEEELLEERGEVSPLYVGRVIGKGGEMIRDLQARSGCRIDVDQNVPEGAPRSILYRGSRKTIDFAKSLVAMLCVENGQDAELPLGEATRKVLDVPGNVIGKIIGRGGEMIRELQNKSQAKIQVDHGNASASRQVTLTGTEVSVVKAEEMIKFLTSNPALDANVALNMLLEDKNKYGGKWGSGPPYSSMPNNGQAMQPQTYPQPQYTQYSSETELFPCPKIYMGRVIGQKGVTVNDLQTRSGCDIQINQDVPPGHDCQITLRGPRQGIEHAKQMLKEIIDLGPNHPYAGGRGTAYHAQYRPQPYYQPQYQPHQYIQQPHYYHYQQLPQIYNSPIQQVLTPWKTAKAADGQLYYYNEVTGESQWDKPPGF